MDTRRLILIMIFAFSSFMLWESWQKFNQPKPAADAVAANQSATAAPKPTANLQAGGSAPVVPAAALVAPVAESFTITTDLVKATISAQGGDIVQLELLKYKETGLRPN